MKLILENPPQGFKKEAEFRPAKAQEYYLFNGAEVRQATYDHYCCNVVVEKDYDWPKDCRAWGWVRTDYRYWLVFDEMNIKNKFWDFTKSITSLNSEDAKKILGLDPPVIQDNSKPVLNPYFKKNMQEKFNE